MDFLQFGAVIIAALCTIYYSGQGALVMRKFYELLNGKSGCNPVDSLTGINLHYFAIRGRAEPIRLILEDTRTPYNQTLFTRETWPEGKQKGIQTGVYTFGQVPAITADGGFSLVQSQAIVHYIGRSTGLDSYCQDLEQSEVIALGVEDMHGKLSKMLYDPNFSLEMRKDYLENILPMWLRNFEKLAPPVGPEETSFFLSERITWVDFLVFSELDINVEFGRYDYGEPLVDVLEDFPRLKSFYNLFKLRPGIENYFKSSRRLPLIFPEPPKPKQAASEPQ